MERNADKAIEWWQKKPECHCSKKKKKKKQLIKIDDLGEADLEL